MSRQKRLINKVKHLIRKAGLPRWLHRFGPKKFEFWHHAIALIIRQECRLSYRRVSNLFEQLGFFVPTYSALAKMSKRIPIIIWKSLLNASIQNEPYIVAIDGTGMCRPLPSPYYYKRIDKPYPVNIHLKLSIAIDTRTKNILSLRLRATKAHDISDAKYLINNLPYLPKKLVADKGYDAEWLHVFCRNLGIKAVIPIRNWSSAKHKMFSLRRLQKIKQKTYGRREMIESTIKAIKTKFGCSVSSLCLITQRADMYCRAIAHNIISLCYLIFSTDPLLSSKLLNK
jgi:hypothetical protein